MASEAQNINIDSPTVVKPIQAQNINIDSPIEAHENIDLPIAVKAKSVNQICHINYEKEPQGGVKKGQKGITHFVNDSQNLFRPNYY